MPPNEQSEIYSLNREATLYLQTAQSIIEANPPFYYTSLPSLAGMVNSSVRPA